MATESVVWQGVAWRVEVVREGGPGLSREPRCIGCEVEEIIDVVGWYAFSAFYPTEWLASASPADCAELEALAIQSYLDDVRDPG